MGGMRTAHKILVEKSDGKKPVQELGLDERIILKWILDKYGEIVDWMHLAQNRY
jgi:hypothetical protein